MEETESYLKKYFDQNQSDLRRYYRMGEADGKDEIPPTNASNLSGVEIEIINDAETAWIKFKNANAIQHQKIAEEVEKTKVEIESEIAVSLDKISEDKNQELDLLDAQYGMGTAEYKSIKQNHDSAEQELSEIRKIVNRPLQVKFVKSYLPFMVILALAEVPVNRLAFELFFEQSPIISLALSGAVGSLFVFFAHIIGGQLRNTQFKELNTDHGKTHLTLVALVAMSLLVMYFLSVMREQLVAVQASANLNLEDMLNDESQSAVSGGMASLTIGSKGLMLLLLNLAIYVSGILMAYFRHDPHPQYEEAAVRHQKARDALLKYQKNFESKQIEMLREFNQKHSFNKTLQRKREASIESITRNSEALRNNAFITREKLIDAISGRIRNYRDGNTSSRKTNSPAYFGESVYALLEERIK
jgi:hypothetical protein